ncbi:MAG: ATP-binding cassette domain-containing protein [Ignavibacteriae bacterium]|nr:ATP-binding cassette domain-containing protein [Ignavibacteriota bacterium]
MDVKPIVEVEQLTVLFAENEGYKIANNSVSMVLRNNEWLGIMGNSGSGKSILARSLSGLISGYPGIVQGKIFFESQNLVDDAFPKVLIQQKNGKIKKVKKNNYRWMKQYYRNFEQVACKKFAYIFQNPIESFNPYLSVGEHIAEAFVAAEIPGEMIRQKSIELLEHLDLPEKNLDSYPHELSGGELQRISVAMALAQQASVIIADECTTSLDPENEDKVLAKLHEAQERGASILFITHSEELANEHCQRLNWMDNGRLYETKAEWEKNHKEHEL